MEAIIIALITAGIPAIVTLITSSKQNKLSKRHSAKQSILQMMMEDVIAVEVLHKLPINWENTRNGILKLILEERIKSSSFFLLTRQLFYGNI